MDPREIKEAISQIKASQQSQGHTLARIEAAVIGDPYSGAEGLRKEVTRHDEEIIEVRLQTENNSKEIRRIKTHLGFRWVERALIAGGFTVAGATKGQALKAFFVGSIKIIASLFGISAS